MYKRQVLILVCLVMFIVSPILVASSGSASNGCNCDILSIVNAAVAPLQQQILYMNQTIEDLKYNLPISCGNHSAYKYYPETGRCYMLHRVDATWPEANATCHGEDAHLSVIHNREEAHILGTFAQERYVVKLAHIGVYRDAKRVWRTVTGDTVEAAAAGYNPWDDDNPDNLVENKYGAVWTDGTLRNIPDTWERYYICEKAPL